MYASPSLSWYHEVSFDTSHLITAMQPYDMDCAYQLHLRDEYTLYN